MDEVDPKKKLMDAAMAFLQQGETPTTRALAERAGVNIASINYYFKGKDNLIAQALDEAAVSDLRAWFASELDEQLPVRDRLIKLVHFLARIHHNYHAVARIQLELIALKDRPERSTQLAIEALRELIAERLYLPHDAPTVGLKASSLMASIHYLSIFHHQFTEMTGHDVSSPKALEVYVMRLLETLGL